MSSLKRLCAAALAATVLLTPLVRAQEPVAPAAVPNAPAAPATPDHPIIADFKILFGKISAKLQSMTERPTEAALQEEIKELDALLAKYPAEKSDEVASVHVMKARLYLEVFEDAEGGLTLLKQIKADYGTTEVGANLDPIINAVEKQLASAGVLDLGKPFPAFSVSDLAGQPLTLESLKGKVVLIDFWATWCGPCIAELPKVSAAYTKYQAKGFEIVGISLDRDRAKLDEFLTKNQLPWKHTFDENGKLATEYGIQAIPATFLLDKEGNIVAKDLRGDELDQELAKLLP